MKAVMIPRGALAMILVCAGIILPWMTQGDDEPDRQQPGDDLRAVLGAADGQGFRKARPGYQLRFPDDHGPHPRFRHEWWYFTGNLSDSEGQRYGYQFTLFRFALNATKSSHPSAWHSNQLYMAHVALTVEARQRFFHAERLSRGALDLAGARAAPLAVWLHDWQVSGHTADGEPPWQIALRDEEFALQLTLAPGDGRVLQGEAGYSLKGPDSASHYYSYPRLPTHGTLEINGRRIAVSGDSWFDREWGSGALAAEQSGWDWFSLQMEDDSELMWYQLRLKQGGIAETSQGVLVDAEGSLRRLSVDDMTLKPTAYWQSPDGRCYPVAWQLKVAQYGSLQITPILPQQWWNGRFRYWEGAVDVGGDRKGYGYLELSGYVPQHICP